MEAALLDLRHLHTLVAIGETGKLSAAAARVHLTPSALSHQVRALEERYGPLLDRSRNGLSFTAAGARLLQLARATLESVADAERDIARMRDAGSGELRIALECHTCFDWLMPVMDRFRKRWPEVELDLVAGFHSDALDLIADGKADVVIGARPPRRGGIAAVPLFRFEILAVLPIDHPLRTRAYLEAPDFAGESSSHIRCRKRIDVIREVLAPAKVRFSRRTASSRSRSCSWWRAGGIAALPSWASRAT
jgi:LysR family transcriptional regulator for metE and metH